jgi:hypothetical protein
MSLATNLQNAFTAVAAALKSTRVLLNGNAADNSALNTTAKASLLAAINEVFALANAAASSGGAVIDDATARTTTVYSSQKVVNQIAALIADAATAAGTTWSSTKISSYVSTQLTNVIGAAPTSLDTLKELADAINDDASFAATMTASLGNRIRTDAAQSYTGAQVTQGQANLVALGMATAASVTTLSNSVGDPTTDFAATFTTALNS